MLFITSLLSLSTVSAQTPNCGANMGCLTQLAQYTVIGTVISNNLYDFNTTATPQNYNATISIQCIYLSFANPASSGAGLAGKTLTVTGFGRGSSRCQRGGGSDAIVNQTSIFFIHTKSNRPLDLTTAIYSVVDICYGAFETNDANNQTISNLIAQYPQNAIKNNYITAPGAQCGLPAPQVQSQASTDSGNGDGSGSNAGSSPFKESGGVKSAAFGTVIIAVFLTWLLL